jgi:hypothetical protein
VTNKKLVQHLILLALFLTPLFGLQYWLEIMPSLGTYLGIGSQIVAIKAAKDVLLGGILLITFLDIVRGCPFLCHPIVWFMTTLIVVSFAVTFSRVSPLLALVGLRGISPFFLIFAAYKYLDMAYVRRIVRMLSFLLLLELCAAGVRARYGLATHGLTYLGLAARPSGTFAAPASWAIFISFISCYLMGFDIFRYGHLRRKTMFLLGVSALLVVQSGSGTGLVTFAVAWMVCFLLFAKAHSYLKAAVLPLILLVLGLALLNLDVLTRRSNIYVSVESRLSILLNMITSPDILDMAIGKGLGVGSNAAITVSRLAPNRLSTASGLFIADSLYAAILSQMGIPFLLAFLLFNLGLFRIALKTRHSGIHPIVVLLIPSMLVASCGSILIELFPVNWLLFISYGILLKEHAQGPCVQRPAESSYSVGLLSPGSMT